MKNLMDHIIALSFGKPPKVRRRKRVTVGRFEGCMAERFEEDYQGVVVGKRRVKYHSADREFDKLDVRVLKSSNKDYPEGSLQSELAQRARMLEDGSIIIAN